MREIYAPLTNGSYYGMQDAIGESGRHISPARLLVTTAKSAELIKHASNAYLAMKISFINAVAVLCEQVGADVDQVRDGVGADARIGPNFLNPGIGYGGSCFPKDIKAFRAVASAAGYDFRLLDEVMRINDDQCRRFIAKVRNALWILKGKRLAVLGLAFKGGTDDIRQSQAIVIIQMLLKEGCSIAAYDPAAIEKTKSSCLFSAEAVTFANDPYQAARDADAVLVLTDWEEFAGLDIARLRSALKYPIMVDGRNLFKPEALAAAGFTYVSVGRAEVSGKQSLSMATPAD